MLRRGATAALLAGLAAVPAALAVQTTPSPLTLSVDASASHGKGTTRKPAPVAAGVVVATRTSDGTRQESLTSLSAAWGGIVANGRLFPTCTAAKIDAAQSDSVCPDGSLVATGKLSAQIGTDLDFQAAGVPCRKSARYYNAGQGGMAVLLVGPGDDCAGVGYVPPVTATWSKAIGVDGGEGFSLQVPRNLSHPLPGVLAAVTDATVSFTKQVRKVRGVRHGYLDSLRCSGQRRFVGTIVGDPSGRRVQASSTLPC